MTGEYNADLQKAMESYGVSLEPNTRYEWAEGLNTFGNVVSGIFKAAARGNGRGNGENPELENEYDRRLQEILSKHSRTPGQSPSALYEDVNNLMHDDYFKKLSVAKKNAINNSRGYSHPGNPTVEAEKLTTANAAKKQSELDEKYISLANATYNQDELANMSTASKVEEGRRIAAENWINIDIVPGFLQSQIPESEKYAGIEMTVDSLTRAIGRDIQNELKKGVSGKMDQWWNQRKITIREELLAAGYPPQYADFALWKASQDYDPMFTDIKQGREDAVKYVEQVATHRYNIARAASIEATGTTPELFAELSKNYTYLEQEQQKYVKLSWGRLANSAMELTTQEDWRTPQQVFDNQEFYFSDPLATANQKMNASNKGMGAINNMFNEATQNGKDKSGDYQNAMSQNFRTLVEQINNNAASWVQAYSENATPEQRDFYNKTFNEFLRNGVRNEMAKLGRDAIGAVTYHNGMFQSTNKLDKQRIGELNGLLENIRAINKALGGNVYREDDLTKMIQQGIADNSLTISNIGGYSPGAQGFFESLADDFTSAGMFAWASIGRLMGDSDYEPIALSPRQAVMNQRNREKAQEDAVQQLRQARAEKYLGKDAIPTPADERGFWSFVGSGLLSVSTAPIRGLYNAPQWLEKGISSGRFEEGLKKDVKAVTSATKRGAKVVEELYGNLSRDLHKLVGPEEAVSVRQAKQNANEYFKDEWKDLNTARKEVLTEVVYQLENDPQNKRQLGTTTVPVNALKNYIKEGDYTKAALLIQSRMRKYLPEPDARALGIIFYQGNKIQPEEIPGMY